MISGGISFSSWISASASFFISVLSGRVDVGGARGKQHLRLEDEAVADDADVLAVGEDLAQPPEEVGAVAVEFLHPLGKRHVQPLAEIGDLGVGFLVALFRGVERVLERGDLPAQRRDLLVEQLDLGKRPGADLLLAVEVVLQRSDLRLAPQRCRRCPRSRSCWRRDFSVCAAASEACRLATESCRSCLLLRSSDSSCVSWLICALSRLRTASLPVISRDRMNWASTNTDNRNMMARSSVDSASTKLGPVVDAVRAAAGARERHRSTRLPVTVCRPVNPLDCDAHGLLLFCLGLDPVAHHLLLAAHVLHQPLDALGQIGERRRGALVLAAAFLHGLQPFGENSQLFAVEPSVPPPTGARSEPRSVTEESQFSSSV